MISGATARYNAVMAQSILVLRPGALGDAVLTLPVLRALRDAGADRITILGTPASWAFLNAGRCSVLDFSSSLWLGLFNSDVAFDPRGAAALRGIDFAVLYLGADTAQVVAALRKLGVREIVCVDPPRAGVAYPKHAARILLDPLREWFGGEDSFGRALLPDVESDSAFLALSPDEKQRARAYLETLGAPGESAQFVAIHPGSGGRWKCWPAERYAAFSHALVELGCTPLLIFGPADDAVRKEFDAAQPAANCIRISNRPLRELLGILSLCSGCVGNDSGVSHLAAQVVPTLAIFGVSDPGIWSPLGCCRVLRAADEKLTSVTVQETIDAFNALTAERPPR